MVQKPRYPWGETTTQPTIEEVQLSLDSLDELHAFLLVTNSRIYIWRGSRTSSSDILAASAFAHGKQSQRGGSGAGVTFDIDDQFWLLLEPQKIEMASVPFKPTLYLVSKEGNDAYLKGFLKEVSLSRESLSQDDVFVLDSGHKIYVWIGEHASDFEKINAKMYADHEEARRGSDPATVTHDVDYKFWELLDGPSPTLQTALNPAEVRKFNPSEIRESVNRERERFQQEVHESLSNMAMEVHESASKPTEIRESMFKPTEIETHSEWLLARV